MTGCHFCKNESTRNVGETWEDGSIHMIPLCERHFKEVARENADNIIAARPSAALREALSPRHNILYRIAVAIVAHALIPFVITTCRRGKK